MGTATSREVLESTDDAAIDAQGLSPFPPEVIDVILETLDYRSVLALLRVNSVFYKAVAWRMVRRLRVIEVNGLLELEAQHTGPRLWLPEPAVLTSKWLPDFIEQLDIYPHAYGAVGDRDGFGTNYKHEMHRGRSFGGRRTLFLNNFGTLRLFFGDVDGHQVLHTDVSPYEEQRMTCSLLPPIRANLLVLRDPSARSLRTLQSILGSSYPARSTRQVYVVGPNLVGEHGSVNNTIYLNWWSERADVSVGDIEIVFWTPHGGDWLPIPAGRADEDKWTNGLLQRWFDRLLRTLILSFLFIIDKHCGPGTPRLTLVNAGSIAPLAFADPTDATEPGPWADATARQAAIEKMLNEMVWPSSLPPSVDGRQRDRIINALRFVTMEEWVAAGRWRGVFDADEIGVEE